MIKAVVVANGALPDLAPFGALLAGADLVVAADGGARALLEQQWPLTVVVGDMDSLSSGLLRDWRDRGGETVLFQAEKDETDLELALGQALQRGAERIIVIGALGGRVDHAMANILLLAAPLLTGVDAAILDVGTRIVAVRDTLSMRGQPGDLLSLLPVTARVETVITEGLRYPLHGETLVLGTPRGVSNVFQNHSATIHLQSGVLLAIHTWAERRGPLEW